MPHGIKLPRAELYVSLDANGVARVTGRQFGLRAAPFLWPRGPKCENYFGALCCMQIKFNEQS